jgi:polysaccharide export outer membrane protein
MKSNWKWPKSLDNDYFGKFAKYNLYKMRNLACFFLFGILLISFGGCQWLNPSIMFKTGRNYNYAQFKDSTRASEYKISVNDVLEFQLHSQDGFKLLDIAASGGSGSQNQALGGGLPLVVDKNGFVKLPILGKVNFVGLTTRQAENMLEERYVVYYNKPFAVLKVTNRRVIIFPGQAGTAKVIALTNNNMTLLEALAQSGGISQNGKAKRVKLIRGDLQHPEVYLIDLSTIDGIQRADLVLQANDIIYVEPRLNLSQEFLARITPVLSILTSFLLVYAYIKNPPR